MDDVDRSDDNPGASPLFSRSAPDNIEVVDERSLHHEAGLWTVSAKVPGDRYERSSGSTEDPRNGPASWDESDGDDLWDLLEDEPDTPTVPFPPPPFGQPYRSPLAGRDSTVEPLQTPDSGRWAGWANDAHVSTEPVDASGSYEVHDSGINDDDHDSGGYQDDDDVFDASIVDDSSEDLLDDPWTDSDDGDLFADSADTATAFRQSDTDGGVHVDQPYEQTAPIDDVFDDPDGDSFDAPTEGPSDGPFAGPFGAAEAGSHRDPEGGPYGNPDGGSPSGPDGGSHRSWSGNDGLRDSVGSLFRSEPVERNRDTIDSTDDFDVDAPEDRSGSSPFSSGVAHGPGDATTSPHRHDTSVPSDRHGFAPGPAPASAGVGPDPVDVTGEATTPGFHEAIDALDPQERTRARTALVVVGALLDDDEVVSGLVVGQMLGHPAVLVLTDRRVLVVNDRPWQPVVDRYVLDDQLEIRGRHDRNMAAIGLGDGIQLSMVDGIRDVTAAIGLVERIRALIGLDPPT